MGVFREVERTYDVGADLRLPDLAVGEVDEVADPSEQSLVAEYLDTPDLRLARAGITLGRRVGGEDAGWFLLLGRADGAREEVREPLGRGRKPPPVLVGRVRVLVRDQPLELVARIRTHRTVHRLLGPAGQLAGDGAGPVLAEVADDMVVAEVVGAQPTLLSWREVEVELVDARPHLLDVVETALLAAGAVPAAGSSKLSRVLAGRLPPRQLAQGGGGTTRAGDVVLAHLREQVQTLQAADPRVRADEPDAVHKMRVATRRLRSALATFRPLLEGARTDPIRDELRWLAAVLGEARDAEVMHARLRAALDGHDALSSVRARIDTDLLGRYRSAHQQVLGVLDEQRYFRLLDTLDALVADPPFTARAARKVGKELPSRAAQTWRKLQEAGTAAADAPTAAARGEALHEVRKAAKRARYAGESLAAAFGPDAAAFAAAMEGLQEVLGDHQDSVVTQQELVAMAARARAAGEDTFEYGRLHGIEQARAQRAQEAYDAAWRRARDKRLRAWTQ